MARFHPAEVRIVDRPEGYREAWCVPAHWTYRDARPVEPLCAESHSGLFWTDHDPDFWSASDAACRIAGLPAEDLDIRELTVLATRRANDPNRASPWAAKALAEDAEARWMPDAGHIHPFARLPEEEPENLWDRYGMRARIGDVGYQVTTGYGIHGSARSLPGHEPWRGGPGTWYSWATVRGWSRWPRRQDAGPLATAAEPGRLLLFVSHRWEDLAHPDPSGRQLVAVDVGLTVSLAAAILGESGERTQSGLPEIMAAYLAATGVADPADPRLADWASQVRRAAERSRTETDLAGALRDLEEGPWRGPLAAVRGCVLVWYDYASMYQEPRTDEERRAFRRELTELTEVQANAVSVIIAGDPRYLSRAWCFLEICGAVRGHAAELTPSWGQSVDVYSQLTRWANITDQLIGALSAHGLAAIAGAGLESTHPEDLPVIAGLIRGLPLVGLVESEGADLIAGSIPLPLRDGGWVLDGPDEASGDPVDVAPLREMGRVAQDWTPHPSAGADRLAGDLGVWVYSTQRVLSLAWASRADELLRLCDGHVEPTGPVEVACTWADARSLADDGSGWTRVVPSTVGTLVIVTQADLAGVCLLYHRVVRAHLAAGTTVVTLLPDVGRLTVARPPGRRARPKVRRGDVLVTRRVRRSTAYPKYLMLPTGISPADIETAAALRVHPHHGGALPRTTDLASLSERRVLVEALARTTASCWEAFAPSGDEPEFVVDTEEPDEQLRSIEALVRESATLADNPLARRNLIYAALAGKPPRPGPLRMLDRLRARRNRRA